MACEFICDVCGKRDPADLSVNLEYRKPNTWSTWTAGGPSFRERRIDTCGSTECDKKAAKIRRQERAAAAATL